MSHVAMRFGASVLVSASLWAAAGAGRPAVTRASTAPAEPATFSEDVAPILFRSCVSCHRAGAMGPMPLTSYQDARPWARAIRNRVVAREMPPWGADEGIGTFANDPRLGAVDIATIVRWVDGGAAEGDRARMPALPPVVEGWDLGTPDLVLAMAAPFDIPAEPRSVYGDFPLETRFAEDRFIEAAEVRPGAPEVTHHANVLVKDEGGTNRIASYSPGTGAKRYPPGVAKRLPKGTVLNLNMHYNPRNQPARDPGTRVAFKFSDGPVRQVAITAESGTNAIDIPPGAANHEIVGRPFVFKEDSHILTLMPRMNERGKDFQYTLVHPDGSARVLLRVSKWNAGWVFTYALAEPVAAPRGSRLETVAHWDNSARNPMNPDPTARVAFGPEIMNGYFEYVIDSQNLIESTRRAAER